MKIFLSWSGPRSNALAVFLRRWFPDVIQAARPWMSQADIDAGARWNRDIERELSETRFGIICLTRDNLTAPWILFESGALAKTISDTFVCPYLIDLEPSEIPQGPLTQFQAKRANEKETWELVLSVNKALKEQALPEEQLRRTFDRWWPDLDKLLRSLPTSEDDRKPVRQVPDMVEEILNLVRGISRRDVLEQALSMRDKLFENWLLANAQADVKLNKLNRDHGAMIDLFKEYTLHDPLPSALAEERKRRDVSIAISESVPQSVDPLESGLEE